MSDLHALQQTLDSNIKWGVNPATAPVDNLSVQSLKSARAAVNNIGIATDPRFGQYSDAWSKFFQTKANPVENNTNAKALLNPNASTGSIISGANGLTNISSAQAAQEGAAARDILFPNGHPAIDQSVTSQLMDKAGKLPLDMSAGDKAYNVLNNQNTFDALSAIYKNQPEKLQQIQNMQQLAQQYGNASRNYKQNNFDFTKVGDWGGILKSIFGAATDTSLAPQVSAAVTLHNPNTRLNALADIIRTFAILHGAPQTQQGQQQ